MKRFSSLFIEKLFSCLVLISSLVSIPGSAGLAPMAQSEPPARSEAFVYAMTAFDGQIYQSTFAPPTVNRLYLIAGAENIIASRMTEIYFWSLTNRYEADWLAQNEFVDGKLEIRSGSKAIAELSPVEYVLQYDKENPIETRKLFLGEDAQKAYDLFTQLQSAYRDALFDYYKAQQDYQKKVDEIYASGKTVPESEYPDPPQQPPPLTVYSSPLARGFVIQLPAGEYSIQLRLADRSIQPGSQKELIVFNELEQGIRYRVMPQSRWTKPDLSETRGDVIYTPPGNTIYLQPYVQGKYNDYDYGHLLDPQDTISRADQYRWVPYRPYYRGSLEVTSQSGQPRHLSLQAYKIIQIASSGLGYEVREFDPESMDAPSFEGFAVSLGNSDSAVQIRMVDESGLKLEGSEREARVLNTRAGYWLYVLAIFPALIGLMMLIARYRTVKKIKVEE